MATLVPRENKDGSFSWRVMIRRKGIKPFITSFATKEDAEIFIDKYEKLYVLDPENFKFDKLKQIRENEFRRKELV